MAMTLSVQVVERQTFLELALEQEFRRARALSDGDLKYGCDADARSEASTGYADARSEASTGYNGLRRCSSTIWSDMDSSDESAEADEARSAPGKPWSLARKQCEAQCCSASKALKTLVLKQLPSSCSQQLILEILDSLGLHGLYNFVYAPTNFKKSELFGYGFVNFIHEHAASSALEKLANYRHPCGAGLQVAWSDPHQGLAVQIERYRNSPVMHASVPDRYKPMLFEAGERVPFPEPTISIRPPRGNKLK